MNYNKATGRLEETSRIRGISVWKCEEPRLSPSSGWMVTAQTERGAVDLCQLRREVDARQVISDITAGEPQEFSTAQGRRLVSVAAGVVTVFWSY